MIEGFAVFLQLLGNGLVHVQQAIAFLGKLAAVGAIPVEQGVFLQRK